MCSIGLSPGNPFTRGTFPVINNTGLLLIVIDILKTSKIYTSVGSCNTLPDTKNKPYDVHSLLASETSINLVHYQVLLLCENSQREHKYFSFF